MPQRRRRRLAVPLIVIGLIVLIFAGSVAAIATGDSSGWLTLAGLVASATALALWWRRDDLRRP